jgi:hypothetical protein
LVISGFGAGISISQLWKTKTNLIGVRLKSEALVL